MKPESNVNSTALLSFMGDYSRAYLASGGPTSRLEDDMSKLGAKLGFPTEVFATPTGIFLSCIEADGASRTTLTRIKENGVNLGRLCWLEGIFASVFAQKISVVQGNKILRSKHVQKAPYTFAQTVAASFASGFALSFSSFRLLLPALASGFISSATWWTSGPGLGKRVQSSIFRDFIGATVTLGLAAACQLLLHSPFEAFSIGGLVVLVPGLSLTTAIAELADQNLVSGTAKLMQAILTLLALGLAYILFQDLASALHLAEAPSPAAMPLVLPLQTMGILVSVTCFGVLFRVPRRSLPWAALTGLLGWSILRLFNTTEYLVTASFLAALGVGVVSLGLGSRFKVPSQVFSVPGIIVMLPGMLALTSFRSFAMGEQSHGLDLGFRVALTAGSIVFGLFTARIPFALRTKAKWPKPRALNAEHDRSAP